METFEWLSSLLASDWSTRLLDDSLVLLAESFVQLEKILLDKTVNPGEYI
jgi:hypothetical protein